MGSGCEREGEREQGERERERENEGRGRDRRGWVEGNSSRNARPLCAGGHAEEGEAE